ncbi:dockerin type I domain-containing protein [Chloroflexota bacterium]
MPELIDSNSYTVKAQAMDKAGNLSSVVTDNFTFQMAVSGLPGDVNGDGNVNALDIIKVKRFITGLD